MAGEVYKIYGVDEDGKVKLRRTESHPKLGVNTETLKDAGTALCNLYGDNFDRLTLQSETTLVANV